MNTQAVESFNNCIKNEIKREGCKKIDRERFYKKFFEGGIFKMIYGIIFLETIKY